MGGRTGPAVEVRRHSHSIGARLDDDMSTWALVKALLLAKLIGFGIALAVSLGAVGLLILVIWLLERRQ